MYIRRKVYSDYDYVDYDNNVNVEDEVDEPRYYSVIMSEEELRMFDEQASRFARAKDWVADKSKNAKDWVVNKSKNAADLVKKHPGKAAAIGAGSAALIGGGIYGAKKLKDRKKARQEAEEAED